MNLQDFQAICEQENSIEQALDIWQKSLEMEQKGRGYDLLINAYGLLQVVSALKKRYYRREDELAVLLEKAESFQVTYREVKTIATYYHRISNGGVQRVISQLIPMWCSMGYQVVLLTDEPPSQDDFQIPDKVKRIVIPNCVEIKDGDYTERGQILEKIVEQYQIDTMVYHAYLGNMLFWDMCILKGNQVSFNICTHSIFSYFALEGYYRTFLKMPWIYRLADQVLTLSKADVEYYASMGINVAYMPNPVELTVLKEEVADLESHNLIWIGRISSEKNPMAAVLITKKVIEEIHDAKLLLVGKGDEKLTDEIRKKVVELNLEEHVELCGFQHEVEKYYKRSAVFLGTSANEGFPCTSVECKMFGIPAVYYELPYVEILKDGKGFISVAQGDIDGAGKAVVRLLKDESLRKKMGKEARESIEQFASFDYCEAWKKVFQGRIEKVSVSRERMVMMETMLKHLKGGLFKYEEAMKRQCHRKCQEEFEHREKEIRNSKSYRLGHALLHVPRKAKELLNKKY